MSDFPFVKLTTGGTATSTRIEIDGNDMRYVRDVVFRASVGDLPTVEVEMYAQAEVEGEMSTIVTIYNHLHEPQYRFDVRHVEDLRSDEA
jgi:hypothetical protein